MRARLSLLGILFSTLSFATAAGAADPRCLDALMLARAAEAFARIPADLNTIPELAEEFGFNYGNNPSPTDATVMAYRKHSSQESWASATVELRRGRAGKVEVEFSSTQIRNFPRRLPIEGLPRNTTALTLNISLLKRVGFRWGEATTIVGASVINPETLLQLAGKVKQWEIAHPGTRFDRALLSEMIQETSMYRYLVRLAEATGHRVLGVKVKGGNREMTVWGVLSELNFPRNLRLDEHERALLLVHRAGLKENDSIYSDFDVVLEVQPADDEP